MDIETAAAPLLSYAGQCASERIPPDPEVWQRLLADGYCNNTGQVLTAPLDSKDRHVLRLWLQQLRVDNPFGLDLTVKRPTLGQSFFLTIGEKASYLAQTACTQCVPDDYPLAATLPIGVEPISAQSADSDLRGLYRRRIQDALKRHRNTDGTPQFSDRGLCVTVVNVLGGGVRTKDADNLVKALLDDVQGILYDNDSAVVHLQSFRLRYEGELSYHHVHLAGVRTDKTADEEKAVLDMKAEPILLSGNPDI